MVKAPMPNLPVSTQRFSTSAWSPRECVPAWRDLYGRTIAKLEFEPLSADRLVVEATLQKLPGLSIVSMASTGLRFRKSPELIDDDGLILAIIDSGNWTGSQLGREARVEAGDAVLCTNAEVACGVTFGRRIMFRVPAERGGRRRAAGRSL
jgi:hypothetical protein